MHDDRRRRHLPYRSQRRHRRNATGGVNAQPAQIASRRGFARIGAFHHHRDLAASGQEIAAAVESFAPGDLQRRHHLAQRQPERFQRLAIRLYPDFLEAGRRPSPGSIDLGDGFQSGDGVAGQALQRRGVWPRQHHGHRAAAECLLHIHFAPALAALLIFARTHHVEALGTLGGGFRGVVDQGRAEVGRSLVRLHQKRRNAGAFLADFRHHPIDAINRHQRFLDVRHRATQRRHRLGALGGAGQQAHLVHLFRLWRRAVGKRDWQGREQRHQHGEGGGGQHGGRPPQRRRQQAHEENPHRIRASQARQLPSSLALHGNAAKRRWRGQTMRQYRHQPHRHQQRRGQRQQDGGGEDFDDGSVGDANLHPNGGQEDDGGGEAGGANRPYRPPQADARGLVGLDAAFQPPQHGLVDNDAVVDQQADGQRKADQRDEIQRLVEDIEQRQRAQEADRHGQAHHRHGTPVAQEQEQHHQGDEIAGQRQSRQVA